MMYNSYKNTVMCLHKLSNGGRSDKCIILIFLAAVPFNTLFSVFEVRDVFDVSKFEIYVL